MQTMSEAGRKLAWEELTQDRSNLRCGRRSKAGQQAWKLPANWRRRMTNAEHKQMIETTEERSGGAFLAALRGAVCGLPPELWTRLSLIFVALCLVKCGILLSLRKELFQTHWRVSGEAPTGLNAVAFYAFVILMGLNLWVFGRKCAAKGVAVVRMGFALLAGFATLFIALTFHEGDKNYLSPVLNGVLKWTDLWAYFSMNLFFRPPLLGAWIFALVMLYYVLLRTGRELLMVRILAVLAPAYLMLNLRELAQFKAELLTLDALGVACLVFGCRTRRSLNWFLALAPYGLAGVFFLLFSRFDPKVACPNPEFMIIFLCGAALFFGATLLAWRRGFFDVWSWLLPFVSASFFLLTTANFHLADNYRGLLLAGLTIPRYFLGEMGLISFLVMAGFLFRRWRPNGSWLWLDLVGIGAVALAIIDFQLTQIIGTRLDCQVLVFANSPKMMWRMAKPYLPMICVAIAVIVAMYAAMLRLLARRRNEPAFHSEGIAMGGQFALLGALLLGLTGAGLVKADKAQGEVMMSLIKSSPWWKRLSEPQYSEAKFTQTAQELGLSSMLAVPPTQSARAARDLNVVLIFQESVYNQHLSLFGSTNETQRLLSQYKDRMELFPNFFSNFAGSIHSRFAAFTGLYPVQDFKLFTKENVPVKSLFEVLGDHGYECSVFYSSFADYTNFRDMLRSHGVERLYDADTLPGQRTSAPVSWGVKEEETLGAINQQIAEYAANGKKFLITYVPAAPHYPFDGTPQRFRAFKSDRMGDFTPHYLNELLYMDWVIASILDQLKQTGLLDRTLVVITADHGEMLGADGGPIGHGWRVTPELANVPLIILDPGNKGFRVNSAVGSQVDLLPTVLDLLGRPLPQDEIYQGESLYRLEGNLARSIYINSFRQFATVSGNILMCGDREAGDRASVSAFLITNHGATPAFLPVAFTNTQADIREFDRFQANFLTHYQDYARSRSRGSEFGGQHSLSKR